jgi:diguanylate cyclase (GGDEF)-like protein
VIAAVVLSVALQFIVLSYFQTLGFPIYLFLIITFSNIIVALVVRHSRAHTLEAKHLSTIDPLTQLCNRRALENAINTEVVRQRRYAGHFSVALIDLDGFKGLNDSKGHKAGDDALVLLANILRSHTRQSDTIARLGGDEFVILMPNTKALDCDALCHSLCHIIGTSMTEKISYPVTASIGYTTIEHWTDTSDDILSIADRAMYQAKSIGKGCVVRGYALTQTPIRPLPRCGNADGYS